MTETERRVAWVCYIVINAVTIYFNLSLIVSILRLRRRTSTDILIAGLASGVCVSALGCGPQCLVNVVHGAFTSGREACFAESFLHLMGMEIQFLSVAAIAYRTYYGIVKLKTFSVRRACSTLTFIWVLCIVMTVSLGSISAYKLVANETFCFYDWKAPVLMYWAWPLAVVCLFMMGYWYYSTYKGLKQTGDATVHVMTELDIRGMEKGLAFRLLFLILMFLVGYAGIIFQSIYELAIGPAPVIGDVTVWAIVLLYWLVVAVAYARANPTLGLSAVLRCRARGQETHESQQDLELSSPWGGGDHPSVGIHIKPYAQFRTPVGTSADAEEWDMGLDLTRSGYRRKEEDESSDVEELDYRCKTPPSPSKLSKTTPSLSSLPIIPTYSELHTSPTSKSKNQSPFMLPGAGGSPYHSSSSGGNSLDRKHTPTRNMPSLSLDDNTMPSYEFSQSRESPRVQRLFDKEPSSPSHSTGLMQPIKPLPPSPLSSNRQSAALVGTPGGQGSSSSDEEGDDEVDPIMALTKKKMEKQQQEEAGDHPAEVPTVTSLLYTISEEPTPSGLNTGSGRGTKNTKKTFFNQST